MKQKFLQVMMHSTLCLALVSMVAACVKKSAEGTETNPSDTAVVESTESTTEAVEAEEALPNDYSYSEDGFMKEELPSVRYSVETLKAWNEAINQRDTKAAVKTHTEICDYYNVTLERQLIEEKLNKLYEKYPDYRQYVTDVKVQMRNSAQGTINFKKHVQTEKGGEWTTYDAYFHMSGYDKTWEIRTESDVTTDKNMAKRNNALRPIEGVGNNTPVEEIFCQKNVGKRLDADYWGLVMNSDDGETEGPLAAAMSNANNIGLRAFISGEMQANYQGQKNTIYVPGYIEAGESMMLVIWVYDTQSKNLRCVGGEI